MGEDQMSFMSPESFGTIGVNPAGDTAAWVALVAAAVDGSYVQANGTYEIVGSAINFSGLDNLTLDLSGAVFRQQNRFSKTLSFTNCTNVRVIGPTMYGRGGPGGDNGEYGTLPGDASDGTRKLQGHYNGVAGLYFATCDLVEVDGAKLYYHGGGGIGGINTVNVHVHHCHVEGIGPNHIAQHENGGDFALNFSLGLAFSQNFVCRWTFTNNRLFNHAFGIAGLLTKSLIVQGNDMGPFPGQHGIYASDCNGLNVTDNEIRDCGEICIKLQQENRILTEMGIPAWAAGAYAAGAKVIKYSGCWQAALAFTSSNFDAEYALGKWVFSEDNHLHDAIVSGNTLTNSLYGIQFPAASAVFGSAERIKGCKIDNNVIRNIRGAGADGIKIERCVDAVVNDNLIEDCDRYGIYLRDCSGTVRDNTILRTAACGIFGLMSFDSDIVGNVVEDSGLTGAAGNDRMPLSFVNTDANGIAGADATPKLTLRDNDVRFTLAGLAGTYLVFTGTTYSVDVIGTRTNMATSTVRIDGPLLRTLDNQFGTYNAGDHTIPATFREGRSGREWYGSAAPATGFHYVGEFCWNVAAVSGNPLGWKCISSGAPGTWSAGPAYP
jgi:parallel beta-helix repeat protein